MTVRVVSLLKASVVVLTMVAWVGCGDSNNSGYAANVSETSNGTTGTSNGTSSATSNGTTATSNGTTSTTSNGTTATSNGTTATSNGTTAVGAADGEPCTADEECMGQRCLLEEAGYDGGYCTTWDCAQTGVCSSESSQCAFLDPERTTSACFSQCENDEECRDGYGCLPFGDVSLCLPQQEIQDLQPDGASCTNGDECLGGVCLLEDDGFPEGFCTTVNCRSREDCNGDNTACLLTRNPNYCIQLCEDRDDCRDDYICQPIGDAAFCTPSPTAGTEVPEEGELPFELTCSETLQERDAYQGGFDRHAFSLTVPEDTTSMMIIPYTQGEQFYPVEVAGPNASLDLFGEYDFALANAGFLINLSPILIPGAPQFADFIEPGEHEVTAAAISDLCHYTLFKNEPGTTLDLNFYFVSVRGIDAATAPDDNTFQTAMTEFRTIYEQVGVETGTVRYKDITGSDAGRYQIIRSQEASFQLVALSEPPGETADDHLSINVFFIQDFAIPGGNVLGISAGLPGAAGLHGTRGSGLVFSAAVLGDPQLLGQVLAHEIGHYLGLFHTTEQGGRGFDPIEDTERCQPGTWSDPSNCPDINNLMFPFAGNNHTQVSEGQSFVIHANPLVK